MSKDVVVKQSLIDTATGEVVKQKEFYVKNKFDAEKGYYFTSQKNRISIFPSNMHEELTDADIGKMFKLSKHLQANTNLLVYRSGNNIKPMQIKHIAKLLEISERSCVRFINKMIKLHMMEKTIEKNSKLSFYGCNKYFICPTVFFCGCWLNYNLYIMFKRDLDRILPNWVISKFNSKN